MGVIYYEKTYRGTVKYNPDGTEEIRYCKFEPSDIGKYIVFRWRYEEHLFWGALFETQLVVNGNKLNIRNGDEIYGVYLIDWHSDLCKNENNVSYKIKLTPVGNWNAWCPNRSWYSSDMESIINKQYNLFEENPIFDNVDDAMKFAFEKNFELYPDTRNNTKKLFDKIFNK
jgi:hypothetical protein